MPLSPNLRHDAAPPLCWLHGFTQTGRSAHVFRDILAAQRDVLAPDLPGHGAAWQFAGDADALLDALVAAWPPGVVDLGGYSLGGRLALQIALRHPERIRRLVVLGATRGLAERADRVARIARDEELAQRAEELGADAFIERWLAQPMFVYLPADDVERATRDGQHAEGLAHSLRVFGTGAQRWLGDELRDLAVPTLAMAGLSDVRFAREASALAATLPAAVAQYVPGAGHAAHLHQPVWTARVVNSFLAGSVHEDAGHREEDAEQ